MNAYADGDFMFAMPVTAEIVPAVAEIQLPPPLSRPHPAPAPTR